MPDRKAIAHNIRIIGKSNGVGLTRDIKLLSDCLQQAGHRISVHAIDEAEAKRRRSLPSQALVRVQLVGRKLLRLSRIDDVDVNVMLEHVWPEFLPRARCNVVVPNPEWFDANDVRFLQHTDCVWAKTRETARIFGDLGRTTRFIGFDSEDRYQPDVPRERRFFHLAGKSTMKGTDRLLRAWAQHPQWPTLTVIQHSAGMHAPEIVAANIDRRCGFLDDAQLRREQNACMFHICPSLSEGWGHYIAEALSVGAVTLTLDAPPMNELVTSERGLLLDFERSGQQRLAKTYQFSEASLQAAVERSMAIRDAEWQRLSANARRWFQSNSGDFCSRVGTAVCESVE